MQTVAGPAGFPEAIGNDGAGRVLEGCMTYLWPYSRSSGAPRSPLI